MQVTFSFGGVGPDAIRVRVALTDADGNTVWDSGSIPMTTETGESLADYVVAVPQVSTARNLYAGVFDLELLAPCTISLDGTEIAEFTERINEEWQDVWVAIPEPSLGDQISQVMVAVLPLLVLGMMIPMFGRMLK